MKIKDNKSEIVNFRVTELQKENLELKAAEKGISVSSYLSIMLTEYETMKVITQQESKKGIEMMTKKEILERSLQEAKKDAQMVNDTNFNNLYQSMYGKLVNGRHIKSKADLLGVLALSTKTTVVDNSVILESPAEIIISSQHSDIKGNESKSSWIVSLVAVIVVSVLGAIYYFRHLKNKKIQTNTNSNINYLQPSYTISKPKTTRKRQKQTVS